VITEPLTVKLTPRQLFLSPNATAEQKRDEGRRPSLATGEPLFYGTVFKNVC